MQVINPTRYLTRSHLKLPTYRSYWRLDPLDHLKYFQLAIVGPPKGKPLCDTSSNNEWVSPFRPSRTLLFIHTYPI